MASLLFSPFLEDIYMHLSLVLTDKYVKISLLKLKDKGGLNL